jgi:hypothetical protein
MDDRVEPVDRKREVPIERFFRRLGQLRPTEWVVVFIIAPAFGIVATCLPAQLAGTTRIHDDSMWPLLENSVESLQFAPTIVLLFLGGVGVERLARRVATPASATVMGAFVGLALVEGTVRRGTHNLIPFELALYAFLSGCFLAGVAVSRFFRS